VSARVEIRAEAPDGPAARALYAEYMALVGERLGEGFVPAERIFATEDAFAGADAAWLVLYEDGRAVACGGLRAAAPGIGEIKRMFVAAGARGRGYGRRLLHELEAIAARRGHRCIRLLTTEALTEARALYAAEGYRVVETLREGERSDFWLEKKLNREGPGRPTPGPSR
jgi:GNAT superfamily N-acetyltransferase